MYQGGILEGFGMSIVVCVIPVDFELCVAPRIRLAQSDRSGRGLNFKLRDGLILRPDSCLDVDTAGGVAMAPGKS